MLEARDLFTGELEWRVSVAQDPVYVSPVTDLAVAGGLVVLRDKNHLRAYDATTGALRWSRYLTTGIVAVYGPSIVRHPTAHCVSLC